MEIVIKITESEVKEALEEYGYEVTPQRIAEVMVSFLRLIYHPLSS